MSSGAFCHKCGAPLPPGSGFCPKCGTPVAGLSSAATPQSQPYRRGEKSEKQEKGNRNEKGEKGEKHEKGRGSILGALVGGLILIWLGVTFTLQLNGYIAQDIWWAYFVAGVGAILIFQGAVLIAQGRPGYGPLIGGAAAMLIGLSFVASVRYNFSVQYWPLIIVLVGILVILGGISSRRRVPRP